MEATKADLNALKINRNDNYYQGGPGKLKYLYYVLGLLIVGAIVIFAILPLFNKPLEVGTATAVMTSASQTGAILNASGYVVAQRKAAVASKGTGRLVFLGVVEGDKVHKDQVIARLEDNDVKAQLDQMKANLRVAEADLKDAENQFNRQKKLFLSQSSTQADLESAEARYNRVKASIEVARAQVAGAEVGLENTLIRAPFDGTVLTKNADVGEVVAPLAASVSSKSAVVTIADMSSLQVEADVSEANIERIAMNQDCEVTLDAYPDRHYNGFVAKIVPTADRSKATVMVKIGFRDYDSRVLPEMSAKVAFLGEQRKQVKSEEQAPKLTIPVSAILKKNGKQYVYKIVNETAVETEIVTGNSFGSYTEIKSGLTSGEKIVDSPPVSIQNNQKIKIKE
jgi:RND family efflux transporter MFP subunit